ncbi:MAG: hypothetical protein ACXAC7_20175 [Candidatus Hodarchaeales archaeon]
MDVDSEISQLALQDVKISALEPYQNRFKVIFKIIEKTEPQEVANRNNPEEKHRLSDITVADDTGSIILTAWDDDIELLELGKYFALTNGYVNVYRDSMRLSSRKSGSFESVEVEFENLNLENKRSEEVHEQRRHRRKSSC